MELKISLPSTNETIVLPYHDAPKTRQLTTRTFLITKRHIVA